MASALDGLNAAKGGSAPVAGGSGPMPVAGTGTDALSDTGDGDARPAGLSPEQARALRTLEEMAALYGKGDTTIPEVRNLPRQSDDVPGYGDAVTAINARQSLQRDTADTFEGRDHRLDAVLNDFSGGHAAGKRAMNGVLQNVGSALSANPPPYNSAHEKQQVNQMFATALGDGGNIVSGGQRNVDGTVVAIDALTKEFEQDKQGENGSASPETKRPTGKAATKKAKAIKKAIAAAMAQKGKPYVWGGTGPNGWDCSGLTQYALKKAGVDIKRTTWAQRDQLRKVTGIPKAGDLVFSSSGGHVLLCIGNNRFIHAPKTGDVVRIINLKTLTNNYPSYQVRRWTHLVPANG
ncbi:C40 family peptidase [Nocardia brevicatena]|uniref:C40 family peptidase n=1 Tax=Nocardia brevicatena TaxID=37327 RepID=UPI001FDFB16E|nr:C40 family peptidase [Nocardia brevicatena]